MSGFLHIALSFPTFVFSLLLVMVLGYWMLVLLGALDMDGDGHFDFHHGHDLDVDAGLDVDGGIDVHPDGLHAHDAEGASTSTVAGLVGLLRLGRVPITVAWSLFVITTWIASFLIAWASMHVLPGLLPVWLFAAVNLGLAPMVAVVVAPVLAGPIEPFFKTHQGRSRHTLIGQPGVVTTGRVDRAFGQARVHIGDDDLLVQVRCDSGSLRRDDRVMLLRHDGERDAFIVEPVRDDP